MPYDDSSLRGDEVCLNMDEQNNFMNPHSPTGFFFYNLYKGFDLVDDHIGESINNRVLLSATGLYLDINWGKKYKIKRNGLTDDIYRKVLIAVSYESITIYGIKNTLSTIFGCNYGDIIISDDVSNVITATDNITVEEYDTVADYSTDPETIEKTVTDRLQKSVGSLTVKYPHGLNTQVDEDTTLVDLIKPYIGLVNITYKEYVI
ncbi:MULTISPECIES: hypothetical protein [Methanobacterium]|uniref:Uncharacterized protein n=1 Tax=Methanobacterium bryantii TaxID=2161 RepID=A0A2A2H8Q4_METBR|nr:MULTISPECIES: hypothetical protein [Methanobacterium]OEC87901.1 hypothetical protein A9507_06915 [Methanobacterium sp. A39]PAV05768.1 hypothetical protein ASJ80_08525 [Methanobacterium bryantii]